MEKDTGPVDKKVSGIQDAISGVFSTQSVIKIGIGATERRTIQKTYWSIQEQPDETIEVQPLNRNFIPSGPKRKVGKEDFLAKFSPEPEFYQNTVYPKMRELEMTVERGEEHRAKGELYSAEFELGNVLKVDEENVRANFGLGLTYLERGEKAKAQDIFERLVNLETTFEPAHKHLFNDFGINLRKNRMYDQALEYYKRALELVKDDENLYYNIARAYYEKGDMKQAVENLMQALRLNPNHQEARQFLTFLDQKRQGRDAVEPASDAERSIRASHDLEF